MGISDITVDIELLYDEKHTLAGIVEPERIMSLLRSSEAQTKASAQGSVPELCRAVADMLCTSSECVTCIVRSVHHTGNFVEWTHNFNTVYLAFGSNVGDRMEYLNEACRLFDESIRIYIDKKSPVYQTEPVGFGDQQHYYNMVVKARTSFTPMQLLAWIKTIEQAMGRTWSKRNYPRVIDIDILYYGDERIQTPTLVVPHPAVYERPFVAALLSAVNPSFVDPITQRPLPVDVSHDWVSIESR